jgi:cysteinyl-tRNA synthetase
LIYGGETMTLEIKYPWGEFPQIRIHNSMTRREENFPLPGEHPEVSIYVCGPTTYNLVHIGNMRGPVFFDVVRKVFKAHGYRVKYVTNFTDVDDKMIAEAKKVGEDDPIQLSARFVHEYYTDLFALGVEKADFYPKVSTHIPEIIDGKDGSVYFDVLSYPGYLKLSGRHMDDLLDESRQDETVKAKRDPRDFALWKAAKSGEPSWDSPWGPGRPGWHIECSVMSAYYLGPSFDIHGGGQELKFPHHENEIAQANCGYPDEEFARIWMHYEWVVLPSGDKMAKSGESVLIREVLTKYDPDTVRMFILSAHYRKEVKYAPERLEDNAKAKARLVETFMRLTGFLRWRAEERQENWLQIWDLVDRVYGEEPEKQSALRNFKHLEDGLYLDERDIQPASDYLVEAVREALFLAHRHFADDFDTQGAMGELFKLVTRVNASLDKMSPDNVYDFDAANIALGALVHITGILGIMKTERESLYATAEAHEEIAKGGGDAAKLAEVLLKLRDDARADKNFELSDKIRDELNEIGAEVRDSKDGPKIVWK